MVQPLREQLDEFTAAIPGVVFQLAVRTDGEWAYRYVSPGVKALFALTPEEVYASHTALGECIVAEDRAAYRASVEDAGHAQQQWMHEFRVVSRRGELRWVRAQASPTRQADGSVLWHGVLIDISGGKLAQTALQDSEMRFREMLNSIPSVAVQGYGEDGTTNYWNLASEKLYGYSAEEAIGSNLLDLIVPPEMHAEVRAAIREMFATGQPIPPGELSLLCKDGSRIKVLSSHAYVHVPGHAPEMFCVDVDLTASRLAELKLQESERRFSLFMDNLPAAAFIKDHDGRVLFMNRYLSEILGVREWQGKSTRDLVPPGLAEAMIADDQRAMATGYQQSEEMVPGSDGQPRIYQTYKFRIDRQEAAPLLGGIALDITERKRLEAQISELAFHDPLTNLPNRRLLFDRLGLAMAAARRSGGTLALMLVDLDGFKAINDTHGHDVGDLLLLEVARRLSACVRETDTVARLGGDEFVVLLGELDPCPATATAQAHSVGQKILDSAAATYVLRPAPAEGRQIECQCTVSIGVAFVDGEHVREGDILRCADMAMYRAKASGRNAICFAPRDLPAAGALP